MRTIADLLAMNIPGPGPDRPMGRPRHDASPEARRRHIDCAADRLLRGIPVTECMARYGLWSNRSVYNYVRYALEYDDPVSAILRRVVAARRRSA